MTKPLHITVLCGGVGGARIFDGLYHLLEPQNMTAIVNTGDDFSHWGLHICPDLDTIMYTLAKLAPTQRGWGISDDSFTVMKSMASLGDDGWFQLGDRDIATHLFRTQKLLEGTSLTDITNLLFQRHNLPPVALPMTNKPAPTHIQYDGQKIPFQQWLVHMQAPCPIEQIILPETVPANPLALEALEQTDAVLIAPSNPFVSINPILACRDIRERLSDKLVVAISPIIGNQAIKGPLADMFAPRTASAGAVATCYQDFLDGFIVSPGDAHTVPASIKTLETNIMAIQPEDRTRLAREAMSFIGTFA